MHEAEIRDGETLPAYVARLDELIRVYEYQLAPGEPAHPGVFEDWVNATMMRAYAVAVTEANDAILGTGPGPGFKGFIDFTNVQVGMMPPADIQDHLA